MKNKIIFIIIGGVLFLVTISIIFFIQDKISDLEYKKYHEKDFDEIEYVIPREFESDEAYKTYHYYNDDIQCRADFYSFSKYNLDFKDWFKGTIVVSLDDEIGEIEELTIGGKKAYYVEVKTKYRVEHYYGIESTNHYYSFNYSIYDNLKQDREDLDSNVCYISENRIVDSIVLK